jgi:hypothetical protein
MNPSKNIGYKCEDLEETPKSIFGYLALNNLSYSFYPLIEIQGKKAKLAKEPIRVSFYDEGAEEETREFVRKYGCEPVDEKTNKGTALLPNIRLICYANSKEENKLDILYGLSIFDNSLLPSDQKSESKVIQSLVKEKLKLHELNKLKKLRELHRPNMEPCH